VTWQTLDPHLRQVVNVRGDDARILQESLALVEGQAPQLIAEFYDRLFAEHPDVRPLFPDDDHMPGQRDKLLTAIIALVTHYDQPDTLQPALTAMGVRHVGYGARLEHYTAVGQVLLAALRVVAGPAWTPGYERVWRRAYDYAAGTMIAAGSGYALPGDAPPTT